MEVEQVDDTTITRTYIENVAIVKRTKYAGLSLASHEITYTLRDRLGSVVTLTDHNNHILEHRSYDPFGKPRYGTMLPSSAATLFDVAGGTPFTLRGFTDHEHIDEAQLIHMNGRVYDYNLGRFLSIDPLIQAPGNSQSLNPYSYIMNNPLAGTDPSGYVSVDCFLSVSCEGEAPDNPFDYPSDCPFCVSAGDGAQSNGAMNDSTFNDVEAEEVGAPGEWKNDVNQTYPDFKTLLESGALESRLGQAQDWVFDNFINPVPEIEASINAAMEGDFGGALESIVGIIGKKVKSVAKLGEGIADGVTELTERVRHFTNNKGIAGIRQSGMIRASDQNSVFTVKAKGKVGSARDLEKQLGIKRGRAGNYVEFNAHPTEFQVIKNPVTGATERIFKGSVDLAGRNASFHKNR
ncbi:HYD1 signature containing ADP-ribosyltransferase family protein [Pseudidiomarina aquimaris]|uniref:HYD1 signature containing ADP-ribosyltransferase family protein n=1 Tax=Pseudidiomarina aquimaris TaxID=641841 RepID=UPI003A97F534